MKRQINCPHYLKEAKKTSVYSYNLVAAEINLCNACEKKLRKGIIEQDKTEKKLGGGCWNHHHINLKLLLK